MALPEREKLTGGNVEERFSVGSASGFDPWQEIITIPPQGAGKIKKLPQRRRNAGRHNAHSAHRAR
jgi:hypothetical protein